MSTWAELEAMRKQGMRPKQLIVASNFNMVRAQAEAGAMVVVHKRGEKFRPELLRGLDVLLHFENCNQTHAAVRLMREREQMPKACAAWCQCEGELSTCVWTSCKARYEAAIAWDEMTTNAK